jgi:hypothetical protein
LYTLIFNTCYRGPATETANDRSFVQGIRSNILEHPLGREAAFLSTIPRGMICLAAAAVLPLVWLSALFCTDLRWQIDVYLAHRRNGRWQTAHINTPGSATVYHNIRATLNARCLAEPLWEVCFNRTLSARASR